MEKKNTPTPWDCSVTGEVMHGYSQTYAIHESNQPNLIAGIFKDVKGGDDTAKANAELIVRAVNNHAPLLEAAKFVRMVSDCLGSGIPIEEGDPIHQQARRIVKELEAIAKAESNH
jgi:hypothetical protein